MQSLSFALCGLTLLGACSPVFAQAPAASPVAPAPPARVETPDFASAIWEPASPQNFQSSDRPSVERPIDRIVIHDIEGTAISAVRWFQNPKAQASSHYVVGADGTVYQMIKERDIAWHAGDRPTNFRSIGIEHNGFAYRPGFFNPTEYEVSARLVRQIALRYNIPRDREHIIGHFEVPDSAHPGHFGGRSGHTDPGPYWDWDYLMTLVRNDATSDDLRPQVITLHPGQTVLVTLALRNTGDDVWPADASAQPNPGLRQQGPVYLGVASGQSSVFYGAGWVSPRFVVSATDGDTVPGGVGRFVVPMQAPPVAPEPGTANKGSGEAFRLFKVPVAPRQPVPFGPALPLTVTVEPWEVAVGAPRPAPLGWGAKETPDGMRTLWRKNSLTARAEPVNWTFTLPIDGFWDVYVRAKADPNRTTRAQFAVRGADAPKTFVINQRAGGGQWQKLGRVRFASVAVTGPGVRPGQLPPSTPPVLGTIQLMPTAEAPGIIAAGDVRLVGPFAPPPARP